MEYEKNNNFLHQTKCDYDGMIKALDKLCDSYSYIEVGTLGNSFMGRQIPIVSLGVGESSVVYVGAVCGREYMTTVALIKFINEYCEVYSRCGRMYGNKLEMVFSERTIHVIPMLDVDGVEYATNGIRDKETLYDKLCDGEADFECERGALKNFIRFNKAIKGAVTLRQQKEGIEFFGNAKSSVRAMSMAKYLSKITGFSIDGFYDENEAMFRELDISHVSLRCGELKEKKRDDSVFSIYANARQFLFEMPFMI